MNDKSQLTIEEIKEELKALRDVENRTGFLYFCLNYVKVSHPSRGSVALHEDMYKWQKNASRDFISKKQIISKKTRQTGFSTLTACYALYRALFFEAQNVVIVSLTQRESTDLLRRVKFTYDHLPIWLKQPTDEFAKTTLSFSHNGSKVTAVPRSSDAGRGGSISLLIIDEFGAMDQQKALLASALPALSAGLLTPFTNKTLPSQLFVISTLPQNPVDNEYLRLFHYAQDNPTESKFHLIDVDTSDIPQYQDPEWHATMRESLGDRIYKIEILGQEVYDMENSLIPGYILEKINPQSPIRTDFLYPEDIDEEGYYKDFSKMLEMNDDFDDRYGYVKGLWVWRDPVPGKQYILVCDVATGRANDFSTILVMDPEDNSQVAEYRGKIDTERLKRVIELICQHWNDAKLSIESTGLGGPVTEYFATTTMYPGLYWHRKNKKELTPGFPMSVTNRANALAIMQTMIVKSEIKIMSVRLLNELRGFGYTKAGRLEALAGHDDLVMALTQYCFLNNVGFAATDRMVTHRLMFGDVVEEINVENAVLENKVKKYWQDAGYTIDDETAELLAIAEANGCSLADLDVAHIVATWKD